MSAGSDLVDTAFVGWGLDHTAPAQHTIALAEHVIATDIRATVDGLDRDLYDVLNDRTKSWNHMFCPKPGFL